MSIVKVRKYFKKYNLEKNIIEFADSTATVYEAAKRLGCKEALIAKSLSFMVNNKAILIILSGDKKIDNGKYKKEFGTKAKMLTKDEVSSLIGHDVGGVCPFAINDGVSVYLDISLKEYKYAYPAAGSSNSTIKLTIEELQKYSNYCKWIDISK